MGTSSSKASNTTNKDEIISSLGERFPFGNDELSQVINCFSFLQTCPNRISFVTDWAIHMAASSSRCKPVQFAEHSILPPNFGSILQKVAFANSSNVGATAVSKTENDGHVLKDLTESSRTAATSGTSMTICCCCSTSNNAVGMEEQQSLLLSQQQQQINMADLEAFLEGASNCSGRRGGRASLKVLFECCIDKKQQGAATASAFRLMDWGYRIAVAALFLQQQSLLEENEEDDWQQYVPTSNSSDDSIQSLSTSLVEYAKNVRQRFGNFNTFDGTTTASNADFVSLQEFLEWSESTIPLLGSALGTLLHCILFYDKPHPPSKTPLCFPILDNQSAFFLKPTSPRLFAFACMSTSLGGTWHRLYTSESDGLSFNRLLLSLLGYGGPTLLIIRSTAGNIFGAFTSSAWKESRDFYGNSDTFLFVLEPVLKVYRGGSGSSQNNYMYCNSVARSKGYDGLAHGIGFGGTADQPRLFIDESFDACVASAADLTFDNGKLLISNEEEDDLFGAATAPSSSHFDMDTLEVWGVGGADIVQQALQSRFQQREVTAANIRKARKVDKAAFLDDFQTGLIESKAFAHRDQIRGRASLVVDDDHKNAYVYEK